MSVTIIPNEKLSGLLSLRAKQLKLAMSEICKNDPIASVIGVTEVMRSTSLGAGKANHKKFGSIISKKSAMLQKSILNLYELSILFTHFCY
jgi:hypothetical protein